MVQKKKLFTPLGVDHIVIACYSRHYWRNILKHIGFQDYFSPQYEDDPDIKHALELLYGASLAFGNVKLLLVDPSTGAYNPKQIHEFLVRSGDFHVCSVAILVDSVVSAKEEVGGSFDSRRDPFGAAHRMIFSSPNKTSFWWQFVERRDDAGKNMECDPEGVDHIAIAVENLKETQKIYTKLGFRAIYRPRSEIHGTYSSMKTVAMQRGGWTVALVEGIDGEKRSQVTNYKNAHGNHSVQHIAFRFAHIDQALRELSSRQVNFRTHSHSMEHLATEFQDIIHYGKDRGGSLLQAFTKPFLRFVRWDKDGVYYADGLFFECLERIGPTHEAHSRGFYNKTVRGLYESIEQEDTMGDSGTIVPDEVMARFRRDVRFETLLKS